jgi:predicted dehydrogenase
MSVEKPLKIAIAGLGRIAVAHAEAIAQLEPKVKLVAVATRNESRVALLPGGGGGIRLHSDLQSLNNDQSVDAVIICYPNVLHRDATIQSLSAGKHVLVEKPIAINTEEARDMVDAADTADRILMVAQSRRFSPAMQRAKQMLAQIGHPFRITISFFVKFDQPATVWWTDPKQAGELILHLQGSHSIDSVVWLMNEIPESVYAQTLSVNPLFGGSDEADVFMRFASKNLASVHLSLNTRPGLHELVASGPEGCLRITETAGNRPFSFKFALEHNGTILPDEGPDVSVYTRQLEEFVDAVASHREPVASGRDVLRSTRVLDAAIESSTIGVPVPCAPDPTEQRTI